MQEIRAFIAIELPGKIGDQLRSIKQSLANRITSGDVRWVKTANIHLTLRFLGNVREDTVANLGKGLDAVTENQSPFSLELNGLGCFPNPRRPRVVWVGLSGDTDRLSDLNKSVESMLESMGWEGERRKYHPHLTLGRVKKANKVIEARFPWGSRISEGRIDVKAIHLIESGLLPSGAVYTVRHSAVFQG
jgi:2'-5' RNA ligase